VPRRRPFGSGFWFSFAQFLLNAAKPDGLNRWIEAGSNCQVDCEATGPG
jgi:hypothetical protein